MTAWLRWLDPPEDASVRLLCFPYAGGDGNAYVGWRSVMAPAGIALGLVELPGRGSQFAATPLDSIEAQTAHVIDPLRGGAVTQPFAMFGYSMGALLAYELAAALCAEESLPRPLALFVAAHRGPARPDRRSPMHALPREELLDRLRQLEGTPPAVLEHPELIDLLMPRLRADFRASETYRWRPRTRLPLPVFAYGGRSDPDVGAEDLDGWRAVAGAGFECRRIDGGHFFIHSAGEKLALLVAGQLVPLCENRESPCKLAQ